MKKNSNLHSYLYYIKLHRFKYIWKYFSFQSIYKKNSNPLKQNLILFIENLMIISNNE